MKSMGYFGSKPSYPLGDVADIKMPLVKVKLSVMPDDWPKSTVQKSCSIQEGL